MVSFEPDRLRPLLSVPVTEWKILTELKTLTHLGLVKKLGVTRGGAMGRFVKELS